MEISPTVLLSREAWGAFHYGVGRARKISGTTNKLGNLFRDCVDDDTRCRSACDIAVLRVENRNRIFPAVGQITTQSALELRLELRIPFLVRLVDFFPF